MMSKKNLKKLLLNNLNIRSRFSYISHKMLFDKVKIAELQKKIRNNNNNKNWDISIIESIDTSVGACFSEFELYGNFVSEKYKFTRPWKNINLKYKEIAKYEDLKLKYEKKYRTITFSAWNSL